MSISDVVIRNTKPQDKPFKLSDSAGLYLLVKPNGSKLWCLKYRYRGKEAGRWCLSCRLISDIRTADLLCVLNAIEDKGFLEIAMRLQQRIVSIMRYAIQNQMIKYNPTLDLSGAIAVLKKRHHAALPLSRLPDFFVRLNQDKGRLLTHLALRFNFLAKDRGITGSL
ncbi:MULTISPECIES: integrase arm-type DNA-binding domain-containing protein [unclassified Serratia (in: enterobacteria)]|uniref:tyrosine-type recombinase/integrase n=1 Tax=unclassified Serratia (in: enterobacteria) TaxID=2647522 RepID=UPI0018AAC3A8|nr:MULTISPECIES: integrase arm-type DNA-binding domain-containing protein [unclassified Serratia (in: enterobacteria)]